MQITEEKKLPNYGHLIVVADEFPVGFMHLYPVMPSNLIQANKDLDASGYFDRYVEVGDIVGYLDNLIDSQEAFGPGWLIEDNCDEFGMLMKYFWYETLDMAKEALEKQWPAEELRSWTE